MSNRSSVPAVPGISARAGGKPAPRGSVPRFSPMQLIDLFTERIEARLRACEARLPKQGDPGKPGNDGRGIARAALEANGHFVVSYTDGTFADLGRVVGQDGAPADVAQLAALEAAVAALQHQLEDTKTSVAQLRKARDDTAEGLRDALARIDALRPFMAADWIIDQDGDLRAILTDGQSKRIGRVVGRDGEPGKPGAPGAPGKDGEIRVIAPADWTPEQIASAVPRIADAVAGELAAREKAAKPPRESVAAVRSNLSGRKRKPANDED